MKPAFVRSVVCAFLLSPATLLAQGRQGVSLDGTIGGASSGGGGRVYEKDTELAVELTLGVRPSRDHSGMLALTFGARGTISNDRVGLCPPSTNGCRASHPETQHFGVLGGVERYRPRRSARVLLGPAVYDGKEVPRKLGGQLQLDAAFGFKHFAFLIAARGGVVPFYEDELYYIGSLGFGFRLQQ